MCVTFVSVVIPTYNRCERLRRSIDSVLSQTFNQLELIIVDDGSTDNTHEMVNKIHDDRIKYIKLQNNTGACHARNAGIEATKGSYIAFLDSDDFWHPDKLDKQLKIMDQTGADIVACRFNQYEEEGNHFLKTVPQSIKSGFVTTKQIVEGGVITTSTILARAETLKANLFDECLPRLQDYELAVRLIQNYSIYLMNEILVDKYEQDDSISRDRKKLIQAIEYIFSKHGSIIEEHNKKALHLRSLIRAKTLEFIPCERECEMLVNTEMSIKNFVIFALQKANLLRFYYNYVGKRK